MFCFYVGFHWSDGKRVQKRFTSKDEVVARRLATALEIAYANETNADPNGKKIWSESNMEFAIAMARKPIAPNPAVAEPQPFIPQCNESEAAQQQIGDGQDQQQIDPDAPDG
jgi:hypothetical protein